MYLYLCVLVVSMCDSYSSLTGQSGSVLAYETRRDTDVWENGSHSDRKS